MASGSPDQVAMAYARDKGYREYCGYAPADLGADFAGHRDHGTATYNGVSAGYLAFTCKCGEAVFVAPS